MTTRGTRRRRGGNDADVGETTTMRGKDAKERKRSRGAAIDAIFLYQY